MDMLMALVIPILVSAAAVWVYSAVAWMVLPHHAGDMQAAPDEDALMAAIRGLGIRPGVYGFPRPKSKVDCKDPKFMEKWKTGPSGMVNVWGPMNMARNMALSFVVYLAVSFFVAYIGATAIDRGASFAHVVRVLGTAGILGYVFGSLPNAIWFQARRQAVISCAFDGVVQGLITGVVFAALWPAASAAS